jgi:hypothetical protein
MQLSTETAGSAPDQQLSTVLHTDTTAASTAEHSSSSSSDELLALHYCNSLRPISNASLLKLSEIGRRGTCSAFVFKAFDCLAVQHHKSMFEGTWSCKLLLEQLYYKYMQRAQETL